jgi:nitrogen fixation/metabolism regulation signal transduction histidine kinase
MGFPPRKKQFIDSHVQGALTRRIIFHWLVFMLVTSVVAFVLQVLADPFRGLTSHLQDLWWAQGPFLLVMLFLLPVFVMDAIKLSHRFAGPIFSLRRTIRGVADGETPRKVKFREGDFWQDLAEDYNAMLAKLGALQDEESETVDFEKPVESK